MEDFVRDDYGDVYKENVCNRDRNLVIGKQNFGRVDDLYLLLFEGLVGDQMIFY